MFLTASCTAEEKPEERGKITLSAQTRVHNSANEYTSLQPGDQVGVYIAEHTEAETETSLKPAGNTFDNLLRCCQSAGVLEPQSETHYPPGVSHVDVYAYAPYDAVTAISSDRQLSFRVQQDQSTPKSIQQSDLLWSKLLNVPTTPLRPPSLQFDHCLSKLIINLKAGVGVILNNPILRITGTKTDVNLNMTSGELTELPENTADITPAAQDGRSEYEAIVIPQTVAGNTRLFSVTNNGKTYDYTLESSKTFDPGTTHTCEITVNADDLHTEMTGSING